MMPLVSYLLLLVWNLHFMYFLDNRKKKSPDYCKLGFFPEEIKSEAAFEKS